MREKLLVSFVLTTLLLVLLSPIGVSVRVVDFEGESVPLVKAATVTIHDHPTENVVKPKGECLEVVNGADGAAGGTYIKHGAPNYNIWLYDPTGYVTVSSTIACDVVYVQYHSSDGNDGVTDIYVDDMANPVVRIDTYMRADWYVEIGGLSDTLHTVKVKASNNSDMTGVIPSPHRATPGLGDNDVWYFCFSEVIDVTFGSVPTVDGIISSEEWNDAHLVTFATSGGICTVYFKHDGTTLYVGFDVPNLDADSAVQIFVDTEYDRASAPQPDDYRFTIARRLPPYEYGENQGTGTGWTAWGPPVGWIGAHQDLASTWNAEFSIPYAKLGITAGVPTTIGIAFCNAWTSTGDYWWPTGGDWLDPSTWGAAYSSDNWLYIWPMFRHDPKHTGRSAFVGPQQSGLKWNFTTGGAIRSSPAIAPDGTIYVGSNDGNVYAINPDGTLKWNYTTLDVVYSSSAIGSDGTIYVGSMWNDRKVYAIYPNGTLRWNYTTIADICSSPAIDPSSGVIYVAASYDANWQGRMYAFYPNGTLKWAFNPGTSGCWITSSPAIREDGVILFGDYTNPRGIFWALNPNGTVLWQKTIPCPFGEIDIDSSAAIDSDGMIYFGGSGSNRELWALYPNGTIAWSYLTGGLVSSSPAIGSDGTIYVGSYDGELYAINKNGTLKWTYVTGAEIHSSPAIGADGTIYVGSNDDNIYAINPNGTLKWNYTTGGDVYSSPAIGSDGTIYVGSYDGRLYAFGIHDVNVTDVVPHKTIVGQGFNVRIRATVENQGNFPETFNVTAYANTTAIETLNVTNLPPGNSTTITFTWNTTGFAKGVYTISANATIVLGEIDTGDNSCTDGTVRVNMPGDVRPEYDLVDIVDVVYVAINFGAERMPNGTYWHTPPCPTCPHNPNADLNCDGIIDIVDIVIIAIHFGETDP